jgi:hypothetical protein
MSALLRAALRFALFGWLLVPNAQAQDTLIVSPPCVSDWGCGTSIRPPLGFYVDTVSDDARYITLEDGTVWEVQLDFRAMAGGWRRNDFVEVRRIAAPTGDYEWLFTNANGRDRRVAVRFAGRTRR